LKLHIQKIRLKELESFIRSEQYRAMELVPVSLNRAKSYQQNPHGRPGDVVLYLGFIEGKLVAFRSLFADVIHSKETSIRFGWCSGNWVHANYRRQGFSEQLLKEAYTDWDKKLMFTNYAPASEQLYLKTGWFKPIHQFDGMRAYLFPKTRKLLPAGKRNAINRFLFSSIDLLIAAASFIRLLFFRSNLNRNYTFDLIDLPDQECYSFLKKRHSKNAFQRNEKEFGWIFTFPWIKKTDQQPGQLYPFSHYSDNFSYYTVKIYRENELVGFFIFSVRDGHMKTLFFEVPEKALAATAGFVKKFAANQKIEVFTVYKKELSGLFFERKFPFLRVKKYGQKIYSTFDVPDPESMNFQDGDGDVIFT